MGEKYFGKAINRKEDPRFITGAGNYVDDITLQRQSYVAMVRSPHAHATIKSINVDKAKAHPGVIDVILGQEMVDAGIGSIPVGWLLGGLKTPPPYAITIDKARHQGEIVAAVIAEDSYTAEDAADLVEVEYQVHSAVANPA